MHELAAAAAVLAMEIARIALVDLGLTDDSIGSDGRELRCSFWQSGAANMSGIEVDAAPKESGDVMEQVMISGLHMVSTPCAQPLALSGSHTVCAPNHRVAGLR